MAISTLPHETQTAIARKRFAQEYEAACIAHPLNSGALGGVSLAGLTGWLRRNHPTVLPEAERIWHALLCL